MSPTTLAYTALRQIMGAKLTGELSSVVTDMFSKIDLDNNGILERDEIRYGYLWVRYVFLCVIYPDARNGGLRELTHNMAGQCW